MGSCLEEHLQCEAYEADCPVQPKVGSADFLAISVLVHLEEDLSETIVTDMFVARRWRSEGFGKSSSGKHVLYFGAQTARIYDA